MKKLLLLIVSTFLLFPLSAQLTEDFSDYTTGEKLAEQAHAMERWYWGVMHYDNYFEEDGEIAELPAGNKVGKFTYLNNQLLNLGWKMHGAWSLAFKIYVPSGKDASLRLYSEYPFYSYENHLALQITFATDLSDNPEYTPGVGKIYGGAPNYLTFDFSHDTWLNFRILMNFDSDFCKIFLEDSLIHSYPYSLGAFGDDFIPGIQYLNIFPSTSEELSTFYMDDFVFEQVPIFPVLSVSPASISEQVTAGSSTSITKPVSVINSGGGVGDYSSWIDFDFKPQTGTQNFTITHMASDPESGIGPPYDTQLELAARFSGTQLCDKIGTYVTKIAFFLPAPAPVLTFRIYAPNTYHEPGELLVEVKKTDGISAYAWNEVTLPQPFLIDKTELWFAVLYNTFAEYPTSVGMDSGPCNLGENYVRVIDPDEGEWSEWIDTKEEGIFTGNFTIKATAQGSVIPGGCWCAMDGNFFGKVLGEKTAVFDAVINPTGLDAGNYSATLFINTNDEDNGPLFSVPVSLIVEETFVSVTDILNVPAFTTENIPLTLTGTVVPNNATNKTIQWSVTDAGTTFAEIVAGVLTATAPGTAVVTATIENGEGIGIPFVKNFDIEIYNVGIKEVSATSGIVVSPNPTTGELRISNGACPIVNIEVFDVYGRRIEIPRSARNDGGGKFPSNSLEGWQPQADGVVINIAHLANGVYFLRIQTNQGTVTKKVIKN
jgi:hypothetical protein